jgi:paraquat-inducible protein B
VVDQREDGHDDLPQASVVPAKGPRISAVWIIPILAALVAIGIAVERIFSEGPTVTITFKSAEGIEAGKTLVKYKDVNIGQVTSVQFSKDYSKVEVTAKIARNAGDLMVNDAKFWVVRPRISVSGVSGLTTLLSGSYIGFDPGTSKDTQRTFNGLEVPPIVTGGEPGRRFVLRATDLASLEIGSPVYYRRLQVGQVIAYDLAADGKSVRVEIFVNAPYDKYVLSSTRFWNASGLDIAIGTNGVQVHTESIVALLAGGLAFDTPTLPTPRPQATANAVFELYADRVTAMKAPEAIARRFVLYFNEPVRGLSVEAPVTLLGLQVGEVTDIGLEYDPKSLDFRARVLITFYPDRVIARLPTNQQTMANNIVTDQNAQDRLGVLRRMVNERGLRAQLKSGNLLTGQLYVAFNYFPHVKKTNVDLDTDMPELPVVPGQLGDIEAKLTAILSKLDNLPLEDIGNGLKNDVEELDRTLREIRGLASDTKAQLVPPLKADLESLQRTLAAAERSLNNADSLLLGPNAPGQQNLRDALQEIARAAQSLRVLTDYLERHPDALIRGKTEPASDTK